tara:strand:+ start:657 stop:902 length:246 start_codon:yes stop_codon:yes gene_type:complete
MNLLLHKVFLKRLLLAALVVSLSACEDDAILDPTDEGPPEGSYGKIELSPATLELTEGALFSPHGEDEDRRRALPKNPKRF